MLNNIIVLSLELIYCDVDEGYMYHQQRDEMPRLMMRGRCRLYIGEIVKVLGHSPVGLHMLQLMGFRYIFKFWLWVLSVR